MKPESQRLRHVYTMHHATFCTSREADGGGATSQQRFPSRFMDEKAMGMYCLARADFTIALSSGSPVGGTSLKLPE